MSAKPAIPMSARPATRSAPSRATFLRHAGRKAADALLVLSGVLILGVVGYVAYRTQVLGEAPEEVMPFLKGSVAGPAVHPESTDAGRDAGRATGVKKTGPTPGEPSVPGDGSDPDNTLFGRRERRAPKPAETAPAQ